MSIEDFKNIIKRKHSKKTFKHYFHTYFNFDFLMYGKKTSVNIGNYLVVMNSLMIKRNFQTQKLIII